MKESACESCCAAWLIGSAKAKPLRTSPKRSSSIAAMKTFLYLPYMEARALWSLIDRQTRSWRLGALALLLAAVGIFGVLAFTVRQRVTEIGLRMAVGAERRDILHLVVRQTLLLVLLGAAIGVAAAIGLTRFVDGLLFGVTPRDPASFIAALALLLLTAIGACLVPALRAMRIDPAVALRHE